MVCVLYRRGWPREPAAVHLNDSVTPERRPSPNYRRGLHRLFVLACIAWAFLVLVVFPLREIADAQGYAVQSAVRSGNYNTGSPQDRAKVEAEVLKAMERATLPYFYREKMLPNWPWYLAALVIPPALFYGLVRGITAITAWVLKGFRA